MGKVMEEIKDWKVLNIKLFSYLQFSSNINTTADSKDYCEVWVLDMEWNTCILTFIWYANRLAHKQNFQLFIQCD